MRRQQGTSDNAYIKYLFILQVVELNVGNNTNVNTIINESTINKKTESFKKKVLRIQKIIF